MEGTFCFVVVAKRDLFILKQWISNIWAEVVNKLFCTFLKQVFDPAKT